MPTDLPVAALRLWRTLSGSEEVLEPGSRHVVRGSRGLAPEGWTGVLRLGDGIVVEAGSADDAAVAALLRLADPSDPEQVAPLVAGDTLGPGQLAYLPDDAPPPVAPGVTVEAADPDELTGFLATIPREEVDESSAEQLDRCFALRRDGSILGVAGWEAWPASVAHIGVLVHPDHRSNGVATDLGRAIVRAALTAGLSPQWRAAAWNAPSRRVAAHLGFTEYGRQFSMEGLRAR